MDITSIFLLCIRSLARFNSSCDKSMMFLPQRTRSSAPVIPIFSIASRAITGSGENSSVIAAIRNFGVIYSVITWSGMLPERALYRSGKQPIGTPSMSLSAMSRS